METITAQGKRYKWNFQICPSDYTYALPFSSPSIVSTPKDFPGNAYCTVLVVGDPVSSTYVPIFPWIMNGYWFKGCSERKRRMQVHVVSIRPLLSNEPFNAKCNRKFERVNCGVCTRGWLEFHRALLNISTHLCAESGLGDLLNTAKVQSSPGQ